MLTSSFVLDRKYPNNFFTTHWLQVQNSDIEIIDKPKSFQNAFEQVAFNIKQFFFHGDTTSFCTVSRHLINKCNNLDLTSFTHKQLSNIITNVKAVNSQIHNYNENISIPLLASPTLDQQILKLQNRFNETHLNKAVQDKMFFPAPIIFKSHEPGALAKKWELNNQLLLGCIALNKITPLGFSGQQPDGLNKLLDTHRASSNSYKDHIWVVGYNDPVDPITFLADLTLLAKAAYCYAHSGNGDKYGGVFFVNTHGESAYSEKIGCNSGLSGFVDEKGVSVHSESADKFIILTTGKKNWQPLIYKELPQDGYNTLRIPTTNEMVIKFDPKTYSQRVYGVMTRDQLVYSDSFISNLAQTYRHTLEEKGSDSAIPHVHRMYFAERFNYQQIILHALDKMGILSNPSPELIKKYQVKGAELMKEFDRVTKIDVQKLKLKILAGNYWYTELDSHI